MIKFKELYLKNFFSVGDDPVVIDLTMGSPVLVSGHNGAGKSVSIVDSICFVLFNKPYKKVNKSEIVNKINEKNCLVKASFDIGENKYVISRGIKPNIFEIQKNGSPLDQSASSKDQQQFLEENILNLNFETFKQVVILSSSSFVPFMDLTAAQRRSMVEDILDLNVFTAMNKTLKEDYSFLKSGLHSLDLEVNQIAGEIFNLDNMINTLTANIDEQIETQKAQYKHHKEEVSRLQKELGNKDVVAKKALETLEYKRDTAFGLMSNAKSDMKSSSSLIKDFEAKIDQTKNWLKCTSCDQDITEEKRQTIINDLTQKLSDLKNDLSTAEAEFKKQNDLLNKLKPIEDKIKSDLNDAQRIVNKISVANSLMTSLSNSIKSLEKQATSDKAINDLNDQRNIAKEKYKTKSDEYIEKTTEKSHKEFLLDILKDDGIKAKAVLQYIPIINKSINKYLETLNFFVSMKLDENFEEEIRVRHRDPQTYYSLSQGERQRIDLALLFTWRDVAKLKNSVNTNLLILDETFDSSLDADGVDNLFAILDLVKQDTNIFVISHKGAILEDRIDTHIQFEKKKNFTTMKRIN